MTNIKELVIVSGKGGTGKTSIAGALAALSTNRVLCDADVDAADLHLLMRPEIEERHPFRSGHEAEIMKDRCAGCGQCLDWCRFGAISTQFVVDPLACEGCGVCHDLCPEDAVAFPEKTCGEWFKSRTRFGPMIHARLGIAEENSGKLVTLARNEARKMAESEGFEWIITDGPPGIGCPVIASIGGASALLIVTEPGVSGMHDLKRLSDLAVHFQMPFLVCVNKADLYPAGANDVEKYCKEGGIPFGGRVPFDPAFNRCQMRGLTIVEGERGPARDAVEALWETAREMVLETTRRGR